MDYLSCAVILFFGSVGAGLFGALSGLGGGIVVLPLLVLGFQIAPQYAIGVSLLAVIATSTGSSLAFLKKGLTNIRVAIFLETAGVIGAIIGALSVAHFPNHWIYIIFSLVLIYLTLSNLFLRVEDQEKKEINRVSKALQLGDVQHPIKGWFYTGIGGILAGLLGIGSGVINVITLSRTMKLPFQIATTTSSFMIGVTAATSASIFLHKGFVSPPLVMPVVLGILLGSFLGGKILVKSKTNKIKYIFTAIVPLIGLKMLYHGIMG